MSAVSRFAKLRDLSAPLLRWARWIFDLVPITGGGLIALSGSWFMYEKYGRAQSDYVLRSASIVGLALVGLCVLFVVLGTLVLALHLRRQQPELHRSLDAGIEIDTGFKFARFRWWPLIQIKMEWARPTTAQAKLEIHRADFIESVTPTERGRFTDIDRQFTVGDIFGLSRMRFSRRWPATVRIAPAPGRLDMSVALRPVSGEGYSHPTGKAEGELVEMRRYVDGDPLRFILWKVYARTGQLLVRTPERAVAPQPSTVAYFVAGPGDEPSASVARMLLQNGVLGDNFLFFADGAERPAKTLDDAMEALIDSVDFRESGAERIDRLLTEVDPSQLGDCLLIVPGQDGPWRARVTAFAQKLPRPPSVITAVDGTLQLKPLPWWRRLLLRNQSQRSEGLHTLPTLHTALASLGGPVKVIHRGSGRVIQEIELAALRAL